MEYKLEGLNDLSKKINQFVKKIGFDNNDVPLRTALIHSEISEMFEAFRKDKFADTATFKNKLKYPPLNNVDFKTYFKECFEKYIKDSMEDELADSLIRLLDLAALLDIDIEFHIEQKMKYNGTRGFKYGGKKF